MKLHRIDEHNNSINENRYMKNKDLISFLASYDGEKGKKNTATWKDGLLKIVGDDTELTIIPSGSEIEIIDKNNNSMTIKANNSYKFAIEAMMDALLSE